MLTFPSLAATMTLNAVLMIRLTLKLSVVYLFLKAGALLAHHLLNRKQICHVASLL